MQTAIDMHEIFERATISNHKSFMVHGAIFKVTKDTLKVGDPWSVGLDSLELLNANTKRTAKATSAGARNLTSREETVQRKALTKVEGPAQLVTLSATQASMHNGCLNAKKHARIAVLEAWGWHSSHSRLTAQGASVSARTHRASVSW